MNKDHFLQGRGKKEPWLYSLFTPLDPQHTALQNQQKSAINLAHIRSVIWRVLDDISSSSSFVTSWWRKWNCTAIVVSTPTIKNHAFSMTFRWHLGILGLIDMWISDNWLNDTQIYIHVFHFKLIIEARYSFIQYIARKWPGFKYGSFVLLKLQFVQKLHRPSVLLTKLLHDWFSFVFPNSNIQNVYSIHCSTEICLAWIKHCLPTQFPSTDYECLFIQTILFSITGFLAFQTPPSPSSPSLS